jgi:hypothetical protein
MINAMEVVSIRLPRALTVEVKTVCGSSRTRKGKEKLNLSEFVRLAIERELATRRRAKRYSEQRRGSAAPVAGGVLTPLMPEPSH